MSHCNWTLLIIFLILLSSLFEVSSTLLLFEYFLVELLTFGGHIALYFSYYLCFYVGIHASEAKFWVGGFNLLCPFSWHFHNVQARLGSDWVLCFLATGLEVWLRSQIFAHCAQDIDSGPIIHIGRKLGAETLTDRHIRYENTVIPN
jgi:hypothetical protein